MVSVSEQNAERPDVNGINTHRKQTVTGTNIDTNLSSSDFDNQTTSFDSTDKSVSDVNRMAGMDQSLQKQVGSPSP